MARRVRGTHLRLVDRARRAAELAEAARILVGRHWAALACYVQEVGAMLCGTLFRLDTVWKPHSLYSAPYCVRGCEGRCGSYKGLGSDARGGDAAKRHERRRLQALRQVLKRTTTHRTGERSVKKYNQVIVILSR